MPQPFSRSAEPQRAVEVAPTDTAGPARPYVEPLLLLQFTVTSNDLTPDPVHLPVFWPPSLPTESPEVVQIAIAAGINRAFHGGRMGQLPVDDALGMLFLTGGRLLYAGEYLHQGTFAPHTHSFVEIVVVTAGEGVHCAPSGRCALRGGDVLVLRPGVWHGYDACLDLEIYNCCFSPELLHRELAWMRDDPLLGHLLWTGPCSADRNGLLHFRLDSGPLTDGCDHLDALSALQGAPTWQHRADLIGRLSLLLGVLARAAAADGVGHASGHQTHPAVIQAMRLVEQRPAHPWTVSELAGELLLSTGHLTRLFKAATGRPPMAYRAQHRVELASALLLDTDLPVARIGREVGWPDPNLFARRFRSHAGLSATAYRRQFAHEQNQRTVRETR